MCHKAYNYFQETSLWLLLWLIKLSKILATMKYYKKTFLIKQLWRSFKFFLFILIFSETNSRFRMQTCHLVFWFFFYSYKTFNSVNSRNFLAFVSFSNSASIYLSYNLLFSKHHNTGWPQVLDFLEFSGIALSFFDTGNVLKKGHFFWIVLEMFLNLEVFISNIFVAPFLKIFQDMHIKTLRFTHNLLSSRLLWASKY